MQNSNFKKLMTLACVLLVQPMLNPGSFALAKKKSPPKAFSFIAEGGKASQGECDGERKIPRKLSKIKDFTKAGSYMGSELQDPEIKGKADEEMWKHFFRDKGACNTVLAKTPSSVQDPALTKNKPELPPDDSDDDEDGEQPSEQQTESAESP